LLPDVHFSFCFTKLALKLLKRSWQQQAAVEGGACGGGGGDRHCAAVAASVNNTL